MNISVTCSHRGAGVRSVLAASLRGGLAAAARQPRAPGDAPADCRAARTRRLDRGQSRGRAGLEGPSRRSRAAQPRRCHRRPAGRLRVGGGALSRRRFASPRRAPPRTRTSDVSIRSGPTAIQRCAPRRLRSTAGCSTSSPAASRRLFQSGFLLALDGQFAASRAMLERLPEDIRQRPQALAVLAADLGGLGDAAAARAVIDCTGGASGADRGRCPRGPPGAADWSGRQRGRAHARRAGPSRARIASCACRRSR